jgi:hypothetical protein
MELNPLLSYPSFLEHKVRVVQLKKGQALFHPFLFKQTRPKFNVTHGCICVLYFQNVTNSYGLLIVAGD